MKTKLFTLFLALMVSTGITQARSMDSQATPKSDLLRVELLTGADKQHAIELIGQIRFDNDVMYLFDKSSNELGNTPIKHIGKIVFLKDANTNPHNSVNNVQINSVMVYPNPTTETLTVNGAQQNQIIRIYNLHGQQITATHVTGENTEIHVGNLQQGTYLMQIGAEVIKIIKQ